MFDVIVNPRFCADGPSAKVDIRSGRTSFHAWTDSSDPVMFRTAVYTVRAEVAVQVNQQSETSLFTHTSVSSMKISLKLTVVSADTGFPVPNAIESRSCRTAAIAESFFEPSVFPLGPLIGETAPFSFGKLYSHLSRRFPHQRFRLCISAFSEVPLPGHLSPPPPSSSDTTFSLRTGRCFQNTHLFSIVSPPFLVKSKKIVSAHVPRSLFAQHVLHAHLEPVYVDCADSSSETSGGSCEEWALPEMDYRLSEEFLTAFWMQDCFLQSINLCV
eukprot:ANDGO_00354.mRNA.1 hypothetical protein